MAALKRKRRKKNSASSMTMVTAGDRQHGEDRGGDEAWLKGAREHVGVIMESDERAKPVRNEAP